MDDLKSNYELDLELLRKFVNEFDPCGLIALGAPADEYDYLTNKIFGLSHRGESRDKIKEVILFVLKDYFGEDIEMLKKDGKEKFLKALDKLMDREQELRCISKIEGLNGMTVNERLFASGLMDEFDRVLTKDKSRAKEILTLLKVDDLSVTKLVG